VDGNSRGHTRYQEIQQKKSGGDQEGERGKKTENQQVGETKHVKRKRVVKLKSRSE